MGYLHINNLYKDQTVLLFKRVYALEKIHGTSAHIAFNPADGSIRYFSGGTSHSTFVSLFSEDALIAGFKALSLPADKTITIYGESYGGKEQGMSNTYGKVGKFVAFDVKIGDSWLNVPDAEKIVISLGLDFVYYTEVDTDIKLLDALRDEFSVQALRNGVVTKADILEGKGKYHEGIILRPLKEMTLNNGSRVIAKHKRDEFRETATTRSVETDPAKLKVLADADAIAVEWVTAMRLQHVLQKIESPGIEKMPEVIRAMLEDVLREAAGEIVPSKEVNKAISRRASELFKQSLQAKLHEPKNVTPLLATDTIAA